MSTKTITTCLASLVVALFVLLSGCGTMKGYSGEQLPASQTALIRNSSHFPEIVTIESVDNNRLGIGQTKVVVLPGSHQLYVHLLRNRFLWGEANANGIVNVFAEAGHEYTIEGTFESYIEFAPSNPTFWVVDVKTGEIVGGRKPWRDYPKKSKE